MDKADTAKQDEIDKLKKEVTYLYSKIGILSAVVQQMSGKMRQMTGQPPSKKRKTLEADHVYPEYNIGSDVPSFGQSFSGCDDANCFEASLLDPEMVSDADLLIEDVDNKADDDMVGFMFDFAQDTFSEDSDSEPGLDAKTTTENIKGQQCPCCHMGSISEGECRCCQWCRNKPELKRQLGKCISPFVEKCDSGGCVASKATTAEL